MFYRDPLTSDAFLMNDIDDSQPYRHKPIYYCTRNLSILNISSRTAGNRKKRFVDLDGNKIYTYLGAAVVLGAMGWYVLGHGII